MAFTCQGCRSFAKATEFATLPAAPHSVHRFHGAPPCTYNPVVRQSIRITRLIPARAALILQRHTSGRAIIASSACSNASTPDAPRSTPTPGTLFNNERTRSILYLLIGCAVWTFAFSHSGTSRFASATLATGTATEGSKVAIRSAWAGLAAGCLHTLAGADHLAALTPLTIGVSHLKASLLGALWGFGHSVGQLLLGLLMVLFKDYYNQLLPTLARYGGTTVGAILVCIGIAGIFEGFFGGDHHHDEIAVDGGKNGSQFKLATFATGVVYGLQPDALFVVLPALTLPTKLAASAYIGMFVLGTMTAMGSYTAIIGATSKAIQERNAWLATKLSAIASLVAILVGATIIGTEWGLQLPFKLFQHSH